MRGTPVTPAKPHPISRAWGRVCRSQPSHYKYEPIVRGDSELPHCHHLSGPALPHSDCALSATPPHGEQHTRQTEDEIENHTEHSGHGADGNDPDRSGKIERPCRDHQRCRLGARCFRQNIRPYRSDADSADDDIEDRRSNKRIATLGEEMRDPARTIPLAIIATR